MRSIFPKEIGDSIEEGVLAFGKKIKGFDRPDAVLSGVESRTSSPVRIVREKDSLEANYKGIYPCGEGAGYRCSLFPLTGVPRCSPLRFPYSGTFR